MRNNFHLVAFYLAIIFAAISANEFDLRIAGVHENTGLLEIEFDSAWRKICFSASEWRVAELICKRITGFDNVQSNLYADLANSGQHLDAVNIHCSGTESEISECNFELTNCTSSAAAGAICRKIEQDSVNTVVVESSNCEFRCGDTGGCIFKSWVCDGSKDCPNGEDENNCNSYTEEFNVFKKTKPVAQEQQSWKIVSFDGVNNSFDINILGGTNQGRSSIITSSHPLYFLNYQSEKDEFVTCVRKCIEVHDFLCKSFAYRPHTLLRPSTCLLYKQVHGPSFEMETNQFYDYYERSKFDSMTCANFTCTDGDCLPDNKICNGIDDCTDGIDENNCDEFHKTNVPVIAATAESGTESSDTEFAIRLANGPNPHEGRVEVRIGGRWGIVCDDDWTYVDANVACRELGYKEGAVNALKYSFYGSGNGIYLMDNVYCDGSESSIENCRYDKDHNCHEGEAAGVICEENTEEGCRKTEFQCDTDKCLSIDAVCDENTDCTDGSDESDEVCNSSDIELRLVGGPNNHSGRVEIKNMGVWGIICDSFWDQADAQVVCNSLGYYGRAKAHRDSHFGVGKGWFLMDYVHCYGWEDKLEECDKSFDSQTCSPQHDAGVTCVEGEKLTTIPSLVKQILPNDCGQRSIDEEPEELDWHGGRIVGGKDSVYGAYPWQVGVKREDGRRHCGGTIISEYFFISAAHCFPPEATVDNFVIRSGDYDDGEPDQYEEEFLIDRIIVHKDYNTGDSQNDNDISLIKIKPNDEGRGFKFNSHVAPACLPAPGTRYEAGSKCIITGWGKTGLSPGSRVEPRLQMAVVPIHSRRTCSGPRSYRSDHLTAGMLCAGEMAGGVGVCKGDSGGPLVCEVEDRFTLYGITSWGYGCSEPNKPGVYVSVIHYLGWIYEKIIEDANQNVEDNDEEE